MREELFHHLQVGTSGAGEVTVDIVGHVGPQRSRHAIDHRHARSGVESAHSFDLPVRRYDGDVADAAQILQTAPL